MNNIEAITGSEEEEQKTNQGLIEKQQIKQEIIVDSSSDDADQSDVEMDGGHSPKNIEKSQNDKMEKESSNLERIKIESSDRDSNSLMSENNDDSKIMKIRIYS